MTKPFVMGDHMRAAEINRPGDVSLRMTVVNSHAAFV